MNQNKMSTRDKVYCMCLVLFTGLTIACVVGAVFGPVMFRPLFTLGEIVSVLTTIMMTLCSSWKKMRS